MNEGEETMTGCVFFSSFSFLAEQKTIRITVRFRTEHRQQCTEEEYEQTEATDC